MFTLPTPTGSGLRDRIECERERGWHRRTLNLDLVAVLYPILSCLGGEGERGRCSQLANLGMEREIDRHILDSVISSFKLWER
jgi:hypothetical protein